MDNIFIPLTNILFKTHVLSPVIWLLFSLFTNRILQITFMTLALFTFILNLIRSHYTPINWKHEIILITGGSNGLGKELVDRFIKLKPKAIIILDIQEPNKPNLESIHYYHCDISKKDCILTVVDKIIKNHDYISILINNAGIVHGKTLINLSFEEIQDTININLLGTMFMTRAVLPQMLKRNHGYFIKINLVIL
jgi:hypothetical protein